MTSYQERSQALASQRPEPAARAHALLLEVCCTVSLDHSSLFGAPRAIDTTAAIYRRARLD